MADYLVNLYDMDPSWSPEKLEEAGITIRRVLSPDKGKVMEFVRKYYEGGWESECEHAFSHAAADLQTIVVQRNLHVRIGFRT